MCEVNMGDREWSQLTRGLLLRRQSALCARRTRRARYPPESFTVPRAHRPPPARHMTPLTVVSGTFNHYTSLFMSE